MVWENFKSLAGAIIIYLFVKTLFVEAFRIPSGSMIPTLLIGDWLFVNKLAYGPTIPFTNSHLPGYTSPKHDDVVVFVSPYQADNGDDPTPTLVKRLIGMPGDTLYMREGVLYRNGIAQHQAFAATNPKLDPNETSPLFDNQHAIEIKSSRFGAPPAQPTHDNWGPLLIPANHYFMMGDNRYCSKDSRYWGVVPKENVRRHARCSSTTRTSLARRATMERAVDRSAIARCRSSPTFAGAESGIRSGSVLWRRGRGLSMLMPRPHDARLKADGRPHEERSALRDSSGFRSSSALGASRRRVARVGR